MELQLGDISNKCERTGQILVVDDNPLSRSLVVDLVEQLGHATAAVDNGRDALAAIEMKAFSLVLMDIEMPIMDGFRAIARIRAEEQDGMRLPVIAMTGHAAADFKESALAAGFDDFLVKPFGMERLRDAIAGQLGRRAPWCRCA